MAPSPPPPSVVYPPPTHEEIIYDDLHVDVRRKIERSEVIQEDPKAYSAKYGAELLDRDTLLQKARDAGVVEDMVKFSLKECLTSAKEKNI